MNLPPNMAIEVNPIDIDVLAVSELLESVGMRARASEKMQSALDNSSVTIVVRKGGRIIGFGRMIDDCVYYGAIWDVAVTPKFQRQGVGTMIVDAIVEKALERGLYMVGLFTGLQNKAFYEKLGFEFHLDYHAMTKNLEHITT